MQRIHSAESTRVCSLRHDAEASAVMRILATVIAIAICLAPTGCADDDPHPTSSACTGNDSASAYDWPVYEDIFSMRTDAAAIYRLRVESCKPAAGRGYDTEITGSIVGQLIVADGGVTRKPSSDEKKTTVTVHGYTAEGSGAGPITIGEEYVFFVGAGNYELNPAQAAMHVPEDVGNDPTAIVSADGSLTLDHLVAQELGIMEPIERELTDTQQSRLDTVRGLVSAAGDAVSASWYVDTRAGYGGAANTVSPGDGNYRLEVWGIGSGTVSVTLFINDRGQQVGLLGTSEYQSSVSTTFTMSSEDDVLLSVTPQGDVDAAIGFTVVKVA